MARRRTSVLWVLVGLALGVLLERGFHPGGWFRPLPQPGDGWRVVTRVIDGDTIDLDGGERIRLIGVETPEMGRSPRARVPGIPDPFAEEATEFVRNVVQRRRVRLEYDRERFDVHGRTLAYVYLEDGTFVNAQIIRQGYGFAYTRFPFAHMDEFRALEREARENRRGLWAKQ